jgi:hypothetical protein
LFPNASIVAKANCREVESAVVGINSTSDLNWIKPFGMVDNDSSEPERIASLQAKGVTLLDVYAVESIYYHPEVQKLVGNKFVAVVGGNLTEKLEKAHSDALKAIRANAKHLSVRIAEKAARSQVFSLLPKKGEVAAGGRRTVQIDFAKYAHDEAARIEALVNASDFVGILQRYPIRESPALDAIAKALGFADRVQYESAVRTLLVQDSEALTRVRALLGPLPHDLIM